MSNFEISYDFSKSSRFLLIQKSAEKSYEVAPEIYGNLEIIQSEWHPLSPHSHLLLLSSDGLLRLFNIIVSLETPEQTFPLSKTNTTRGFGLRDPIESALFFRMGVDMMSVVGVVSLGSDEDEKHDVIIISPVLPLSYTFPSSHSSTRHSSLNSDLAYWRNEFYHNPHSTSAFPVARQCVRLEPVCDSVIVDLISTDLENTVILYESGDVVSLFHSPSEPVWILSASMKIKSPIWHIAAIVNLSGPGRFLKQHGKTFIVSSGKAIFQIQFDPTYEKQPLCKCLVEAEDDDSIKTFEFEGERATCVTENGWVWGGDVHDVMIWPFVYEAGLEEVSKVYQSVLEGSTFDYSAENSARLQIDDGKQQYPEFIGDDQDEGFKKAMQLILQTRKSIERMSGGSAKLAEREILQKQEFDLQRDCLAALSSKSSKTRLERLAILKINHEKLEKKTSAMVAIMFDMSQPQLSSQEIKWCGQLRDTLDSIDGVYTPLLAKVKESAKSWSTEESEETGEMLGTRQMREIKGVLSNEWKELSGLREKVEGLKIVVEVAEECLWVI